MTAPTDVPLVGGRLCVGDIEITALNDGFLRFPPRGMFPDSSDADWDAGAHGEWLDADGLYTIPIGCFLVRTPQATVLVDTGLGDQAIPGIQGEGGRLTLALTAAGVDADDVDVVVATHLHLDHVGGTVDARRRPAFGRAVYRVPEADLEWQRREQPTVYEARVEPLLDRLEPSPPDADVVPGVAMVAAPGHTPGHSLVRISSGGERAVLLGDLVHCPAQLTETDWAMIGDVDAALARRTREAFLAELDGDTAVGTAHFPGLRFGRVLSGASGRAWTVLP